MKLQVLVPQYKENDAVVKPLLDSIAVQQNVDFNEISVIICNDGSDVRLTDALLNAYPFKVEYFMEPHRGVSATRNACLDRATADYVMFCDADDMFFNACGLYIVFREMANGGFDSMVSAFLEESRDPATGGALYITHDTDVTFVHGKIHRREYLLREKIRFNDALTIHEDSYFNCLCQKLSENVKYCPTPFYLWRWRDESVCRHDPKYMLKTYINMLDSSTALADEFLRRGKTADAQFVICNIIYDAYFLMNKREWLDQQNQQYRTDTEKRFKEYYMRFNHVLDGMAESTRAQIIMGQKNRFFGEGLLLESITFEEWIKHITNDY